MQDWQSLFVGRESERLMRQFGESPRHLHDVSISQAHLAEILAMQDRHQDALALYRKSLAIHERLVREFRKSSE